MWRVGSSSGPGIRPRSLHWEGGVLATGPERFWSSGTSIKEALIILLPNCLIAGSSCTPIDSGHPMCLLFPPQASPALTFCRPSKLSAFCFVTRDSPSTGDKGYSKNAQSSSDQLYFLPAVSKGIYPGGGDCLRLQCAGQLCLFAHHHCLGVC